jgi:hypothetical protein
MDVSGLSSFDQVAGTYAPRSTQAASATGLEVGTRLQLRLIRTQGLGDPYPGEAALAPATPECIDKFRGRAHLHWISSGDVRIDIVNGRPTHYVPPTMLTIERAA